MNAFVNVSVEAVSASLLKKGFLFHFKANVPVSA